MNCIINFTRRQVFIDKMCRSCNCSFKVSKHKKEKYQKKFCSSSCSATFNNKGRIVSKDQKTKTRNALLKPLTTNKCIECQKLFLPPVKNRKKKTCSLECYNKYKIKNMPKPKTPGGYRQGSGRSKHGYYKGIYCGSTYELCWIIYSLDHNIKFKRFPSFLQKDKIKYYPDFLLEDGKTIIETKGYEAVESVNKKTKLAESLGYTVIVLRKKDLAPMFEYVAKKYKTKKFYTLYDNYTPGGARTRKLSP
jgi:hypothetical protein